MEYSKQILDIRNRKLSKGSDPRKSHCYQESEDNAGIPRFSNSGLDKPNSFSYFNNIGQGQKAVDWQQILCESKPKKCNLDCLVRRNDTNSIKMFEYMSSVCHNRSAHGEQSILNRSAHGEQSILNRSAHGEQGIVNRSALGEQSILNRSAHGEQSILNRSAHGEKSILKSHGIWGGDPVDINANKQQICFAEKVEPLLSDMVKSSDQFPTHENEVLNERENKNVETLQLSDKAFVQSFVDEFNGRESQQIAHGFHSTSIGVTPLGKPDTTSVRNRLEVTNVNEADLTEPGDVYASNQERVALERRTPDKSTSFNSANTGKSYYVAGDCCTVPCNSWYNDEGSIKVLQEVPGLAWDKSRDERLQKVFRKEAPTPVRDPIEDFIDDSIFPTTHKLATSEDLNAAMKQAMKNDRRPVTSEKSSTVGFKFAPDEGAVSSLKGFTPTTRGDLQRKYRNVVSAMHRRSFDQWKAAISARAGQTQDPDEMQIKDATNHLIEEYAPPVCQNCVQFNMSNIYGKPCACKKLDKCPINMNGHANLKFRNSCHSLATANIINRQNRFHRMGRFIRSRGGISRLGGVSQLSYPRCEKVDAAGRNFRRIGLLSDDVTQSHYKPSVSGSTIRVKTQANESSRNSPRQVLDDDQNIESGRSSPAPRANSTLQGWTSKTERRTEDLHVLKTPERKCGPLRQWEIQNLETTLKKMCF